MVPTVLVDGEATQRARHQNIKALASELKVAHTKVGHPWKLLLLSSTQVRAIGLCLPKTVRAQAPRAVRSFRDLSQNGYGGMWRRRWCTGNPRKFNTWRMWY